jgi:hypothetical protein
MTAAATLRAAAQLIRERGWGQGDYVNASGCFCSVGAIRAACGIQDFAGQSKTAPSSTKPVREALGWLSRSVGRVLMAGWNDAPDRTVDDVLAAFDRAATLAEGAGS